MSDLRVPSRPPVRCACLVVLDGWGLAPAGPGNAVSLARTPVFDGLWQSFPHTTLTACGRAVGLPEGQMGNSEVGHLNLGAGAVVRQDLVRIDDAIADGTFAENRVLREAMVGRPGSPAPARVHLLGLVSDGGVHSSLEHLRALVAMARALEVEELVVHAFTDGRDTLPHAGAGYLAELDRTPSVRVGSVVGRYWAMDRDRRWDRTQRAYDMLLHGRAPHRAPSGEQAVRVAYERGETDEFIEPTLVGGEARIRPGDSVLAFNFRPDRMRQLTRALAEPDFGTVADQDGALPGWAGRGGAPADNRDAAGSETPRQDPAPRGRVVVGDGCRGAGGRRSLLARPRAHACAGRCRERRGDRPRQSGYERSDGLSRDGHFAGKGRTPACAGRRVVARA